MPCPPAAEVVHAPNRVTGPEMSVKRGEYPPTPESVKRRRGIITRCVVAAVS